MANVASYNQRTITIADAADTVIVSGTDQYDVDEVTLHVKNEHASVAFDVAQLEFQSHPDSGWGVVEAIGWTTADNIVLTANNLATLAGGAEMIVKFRTEGVYAWRIVAQGNAAATGPVQVWGVGKGEQTGVLAT